MTIREAEEADLSSICKLSDEINLDHHVNMPKDFLMPGGNNRDQSYWQSFMERESSAVFVAEQNAVIVGVIAASVSNAVPFPFLVSRPRAHVATVIVASEFRGKGIGRDLMSSVEVFAKEKGAADIRLEVMAFNTNALEFYEGLDYEVMSYRLTKSIS